MIARTETIPGSARGLVLRLSLADLIHEWILSFCMILAVAAIVAPLMVLLGLKHGTVTTLRERLVEDPVNREIKPKQTLRLTPNQISELDDLTQVEFVIPSILRGASVVRVAAQEADRGRPMDMVPTAPGDPLLLENGASVPLEGQCVLSAGAAERLGMAVGDTVYMSINRKRAGRRETQILPLTLVSILARRADGLDRIYVPLDLVRDTEDFREGRAVASRGWEGDVATPKPSFRELLLLTEEPLDERELQSLLINSGFAQLTPVSDLRGLPFPPVTIPAEWSAYRLVSTGNPVRARHLNNLRQRLRGKGAVIAPLHSSELRLAGHPLHAVGLSLKEVDAARLSVSATPWKGMDLRRPGADFRQLVLPKRYAGQYRIGQRIWVEFTGAVTVEFPVRIAGFHDDKGAWMPVALAGVLNTAEMRGLRWNDTYSALELERPAYRGFRLYAASIDDVPPLNRYFMARNMEVATRAAEIEKVRILDRGLSRIFWLIAVIGMTGGVAALAASLYASVERKQRDIGVMRLMGLPRARVAAFPVYQGLVLVLGAFVIASIAYLSISSVINQVFASDFGLGEAICRLPPLYFLVLVLVTSLVAVFSAGLASLRATRIEPADAIRDE